MAEPELFTLRPATEDDMSLMNMYAYGEGMDDMPGIDGITVAASPDDMCIGFIRIEESDAPEFEGVGFINPVVVFAPWRGFGVGRALVEDAQARYKELRLVSRTVSHEFYRALGFHDVEWDAIKPSIAADCDGCPMYAQECNPQPMGRTTDEQAANAHATA